MMAKRKVQAGASSVSSAPSVEAAAVSAVEQREGAQKGGYSWGSCELLTLGLEEP